MNPLKPYHAWCPLVSLQLATKRGSPFPVKWKARAVHPPPPPHAAARSFPPNRLQITAPLGGVNQSLHAVADFYEQPGHPVFFFFVSERDPGWGVDHSFLRLGGLGLGERETTRTLSFFCLGKGGVRYFERNPLA